MTPSTARRSSTPKVPRRVSGPLGGVAVPRRISTPGRRTSAPARSAPRPRSAAPRPSVAVGARALAFARALPAHQLLDRIVRGRAWIPLLGILLAGIVAMQVEVLKLGAGIGRSIERSTQLQSRNELLRASVASLVDDRRIESLAAGMGMVMPAPDAITFLPLRSPGSVQRAAANIHPPNSAAFTASLPTSASAAAGASTTGTAPVTPTTAGSASAPVTPTTTSTTIVPAATGAGSASSSAPSAGG